MTDQNETYRMSRTRAGAINGRSRPRFCPRRGFKRIEAIVLAAVAVVGAVFVLLWVMRSYTIAHRIDCAKNLQQLGQALLLYSNNNRGAYPRVRKGMIGDSIDPDPKPVYGTGVTAKNPFADDGPAPNDVTAALFLLTRYQDVPPQRFICPSSWDRADNVTPAFVKQRSNFTDYRRNLSYSYANPYPSMTAIGAGYKLNNTISAEFAVMADRNPGNSTAALTKDSPPADIRRANSRIHLEGQNVLYGDGHVAFQITPFCGVNQDNIYTTADGKVNGSPVDANDSILLPAQE